MTETPLMEMVATHVAMPNVETVELTLVRNAMPAWVILMSCQLAAEPAANSQLVVMVSPMPERNAMMAMTTPGDQTPADQIAHAPHAVTELLITCTEKSAIKDLETPTILLMAALLSVLLTFADNQSTLISQSTQLISSQQKLVLTTTTDLTPEVVEEPSTGSFSPPLHTSPPASLINSEKFNTIMPDAFRPEITVRSLSSKSHLFVEMDLLKETKNVIWDQ
jgi:hypothetical protein